MILVTKNHKPILNKNGKPIQVGDVPMPEVTIPIYLECAEAGSSVMLDSGADFGWTGKYSSDGINWWNYTLGTEIWLERLGDRVYFIGTQTTAPTLNTGLRFELTGKIASGGNLMSLISGDEFATEYTIDLAYIFSGLFRDQTALISAPGLYAYYLSNYCYAYMF